MENLENLLYPEKGSTSAKWVAIIGTIFYTLLYPIFFISLPFSLAAFGNDSLGNLGATIIIIFYLLLTLSMPFSVYLMWSRYVRKQYRTVKYGLCFPFFFFITAPIIILLVSLLIEGIIWIFNTFLLNTTR